jgi:hypothetical protein
MAEAHSILAEHRKGAGGGGGGDLLQVGFWPISGSDLSRVIPFPLKGIMKVFGRFPGKGISGSNLSRVIPLKDS